LIIGSPLTGYFSDKIGNLKLIMVFGAGSSFFLILPFLLIHHMTFIQITLLLTLLGMSISTQNVAFVVIADNNLEETLSMATGTASFILNAVGALSQLLFGWLLKASWQDLNYMTTSSLIKSSYVSSVLIFPLAFLLCVFLAIFSLNKKL
jgi:MFS family permease